MAIFYFDNRLFNSVSKTEGEREIFDWAYHHYFDNDGTQETLATFGINKSNVYVGSDAYNNIVLSESVKGFDYQEFLELNHLEPLLKESCGSFYRASLNDNCLILDGLEPDDYLFDGDPDVGYVEVLDDVAERMKSVIELGLDECRDKIYQDYHAWMKYESSISRDLDNNWIEFLTLDQFIADSGLPEDSDDHDFKLAIKEMGYPEDVNVICLMEPGETEESISKEIYASVSNGNTEIDNEQWQQFFHDNLYNNCDGPTDSALGIIKYYLKEAPALDLNSTNWLGQTAIYQAVVEKDSEAVDFLLDAGVDLNKHAQFSAPIAHTIAWTGDLELLKKAVSFGADMHLINEYGENAIFFGIKSGKPDVVAYLIESNIDLNVKNELGQTPLSYALELFSNQDSGSEEIAMQLIEAGANVAEAVSVNLCHWGNSVFNGVDSNEGLDFSLRHRDRGQSVINMIRQHWPDDEISIAQVVCRDMNLDLDSDVWADDVLKNKTFDKENSSGLRPLPAAVFAGFNSIAKVFLAGGANPNDYAALVDDPDKEKDRNYTIGELAIETNNITAFKLLLDAGMDIDFKPEKGASVREVLEMPATSQVIVAFYENYLASNVIESINESSEEFTL